MNQSQSEVEQEFKHITRLSNPFNAVLERFDVLVLHD